MRYELTQNVRVKSDGQYDTWYNLTLYGLTDTGKDCIEGVVELLMEKHRHEVMDENRKESGG